MIIAYIKTVLGSDRAIAHGDYAHVVSVAKQYRGQRVYFTDKDKRPDLAI